VTFQSSKMKDFWAELAPFTNATHESYGFMARLCNLLLKR